MKNVIPNISSTDHLQPIHYDYLEVAYQSCKEFQERIRKQGIRNFNVWMFLEQEFHKHHSTVTTNRKPPKAVTIEQWFSKNHLSGSKMGTEDLKLICKFVNNSDAIVAFYEETIKEFFPHTSSIIKETTNLNSLVLKLGALRGNLFDEFNNAIPNGISREESQRLTAATDAIAQQCKKIIANLKKGASK